MEEAGPSRCVRGHVCSKVEAGVQPMPRKWYTCAAAAAGGASSASSRLAARPVTSFDNDVEVLFTPKVVHDVIDLDSGEDDANEDSSQAKASFLLPLSFFFE